MKSICFVCHGNICRSPMAEFVFKEMLRQRGL
ncbi:MAG TPA: low molecular weight phosphatase family protein, partial [Ruminococcaceae bacterium]|nr:low molecular weight phosphatase family protein [Oscillospiraceae bacterium]